MIALYLPREVPLGKIDRCFLLACRIGIFWNLSYKLIALFLLFRLTF